MKNREEILGILLPDQGEQFLLPNVSIAEIFTLQIMDFQSHFTTQPFSQDQFNDVNIEAKSTEKNTNSELKEKGIIGTVTWRQTTLPLFHLSPLMNPNTHLVDLDLIDRPRIAVINPVTKPGHPCYAILSTNTPRLTRLKSSDLVMETPMDEHNSFAYRCILGGETVLIPDLLYLEKQTLGLVNVSA